MMMPETDPDLYFLDVVARTRGSVMQLEDTVAMLVEFFRRIAQGQAYRLYVHEAERLAEEFRRIGIALAEQRERLEIFAPTAEGELPRIM